MRKIIWQTIYKYAIILNETKKLKMIFYMVIFIKITKCGWIISKFVI